MSAKEIHFSSDARTEIGHPCEIMGDLQFIRRHRGSLDGLKVAFVGEVSNLCMSWLEAAVRLPITVTQIAPEEYLASLALINGLNAEALGHDSTSTDLSTALENVDLIYTDCWPKPNATLSKDQIRDWFLPYQITASHLSGRRPICHPRPCRPMKP